MDPETITAIGSLWPLGLIFLIAVFLVLFRRQIRRFLDTITTVQARWGDRELSASRPPEQPDVEPSTGLAAQSEDQALAIEGPSPTSGDLVESEPKTSEDLQKEMIRAFFDGDVERGDELYAQLQDTESNPVKKLRNEAQYLHLQYRSGNPSALEELKKLAADTESSSEAISVVHSFLGMSFELSNDLLKAREAYEFAAGNAPTDKGRAHYAVSSAKCIFAVGERDEAYERITREIAEASDNEALFTLWAGLGYLYYRAEEEELRAIALGKALEYNPSDTDTLFGSAYAYSQSNLHALAMLHYHSLLGFQPKNATSWNNLGAEYERLQLVGLAVDTYRRAFDEDSTLAAANLAFQYLEAGFFEEAMQLVEEAREREDVHANVGRAFASVSEKQEWESDRRATLNDAAQAERQFLLSFAEAYLISSTPPTLEGTWRFSEGEEADVSTENKNLEIRWVRNNVQNRIVATIRNHGAKITTYSREYYYGSLWDQGYSYITDDDKQIRIMSRPFLR